MVPRILNGAHKEEDVKNKVEREGKVSSLQKPENDYSSPLPAIDGKELFGLVGTALSWAWYFSLFFSRIAVLPFDPLLRIEPLFRVAGLLGIALGFCLLLLLRRHLIKRTIRICFFTLASVVPLALILLTAHSMHNKVLFLELEFICWLCAGLSVCFFTMNQTLFFGTVNAPSRRHYYLAISLILGALFYALLSIVFQPADLIFLATIPSLSAACFYVSNHSEHTAHAMRLIAKQPLRQALHDCFNALPNRLLHGVVFGLSLNIAISMAVNITGSFSPLTGIALCLPGPLLLLLLFGKSTLNIDRIQWSLIVVMAIALVVSLLLESWWIIATLSVTALCFVLFQGAHLVELSEIINEKQDNSLTILLFSMAVVSLGILLGWAAGSLMLIDSNYESMLFPWSIAAAAVLLILSLAWQGRPGNTRNITLHVSRKQDDSQGRWKRAVSFLCNDLGLSKRQSEIFGYLAKGRNASSIARDLVVSEHTVKAHVYRIYQKLAIHSQQELIDLVEEQIKRAAYSQ